MANVNKVILIGNVTRDPEIKYTQSGTAVTEVGLAINRRLPSRGDGEPREEVTFVGVTFWDRLAEVAAKYAVKGKPIYVEGRLSQDTWEDKQTGQKRSKTKVVGEVLQLLGGGSGANSFRLPPDGDAETKPAASGPARNASRSDAGGTPDQTQPEDGNIPW